MTGLEPLASTKDVEDALGRTLYGDETARVGAILNLASALFRREAGQSFTAGESHVRLRVTAGRVHLPQRPVLDVLDVVDDLPPHTEVPWTRLGQDLDVPRSSSDFVRVRYAHGGAVPDVVRLAIADLARKVLQIDPRAVAGITQTSEADGPFSQGESFATWAQGGQVLLSPADIALARSYRRRRPRLLVQVP